MDAMQQFGSAHIAKIDGLPQWMFAGRAVHVDIDRDIAHALGVQNFRQQLPHPSETHNNHMTLQCIGLGFIQRRRWVMMTLLPDLP